ncbi:class I SAM-dependent methyltransferase [Streptomyces sp. NBC_00338]|uniref:class I SAM-dependent methyltransferase n=1 Tax=Streptomyces sp. NBC_00338 TaxID=2975715 RepID=UPI0022531A2A|nr:class I SAM-dependent methyltransferase [Streptomyces sp. NBC_00338]MCX5139546.1 class I SAM-dependent methyltransferase [Streptomyces sp. NBC_00338]
MQPSTDHPVPLDRPVSAVRHFYDDLAAGYDLMYADWEASIARQAAALSALIEEAAPGGRDRCGGDLAYDVLDCACGIGTQALGLAARGHRVTGSDLSPVAAARAAKEAAARGLDLRVTAADMTRLPYRDGSFDVVVCADNSLPHLLTPQAVLAALGEMRRVLRPGGVLLLSTRPYDRLRRERPASTPPQVREGADGRVVTFQLWHWRPDGERYDLEHFQLLPGETPDGEVAGERWGVRTRRTSYWALSQAQIVEFTARAGLREPVWHEPDESDFFQPVLVARRPEAVAKVTGHDHI